jgi:excisionase family DNA binding protein
MDLTKLFKRDKVLLKVSEAARRLDISVKTVYNYIYTGKLKASRIKKHWRISEDELEKFINQRHLD